MEGATLLIHSPDVLWSLPFLLYAETHYRFRYFFSWLKKSEPEIIADAPHRLEPREDIPLLVLAKDADVYPTRLTRVHVEIRQGDELLDTRELLSAPELLHDPFWWNVYSIPRPPVAGWIDVHVHLAVERKGITRVYRSDNHRSSSHDPLRVYLSRDPLPRFPGLHFGEPHAHSEKTSDQVEFGVPVHATVPLARSMGLSFSCVTDHSYDLDDSLNDYTVNDPAAPKWELLGKEIKTANAANRRFAVIRGEEISCRNAEGKNVHFLLLGNKQFIPGSGDGAEQWLKTRSEHSIADVLHQKDNTAPAFAAHPAEPVPFLQRLLLSRGSWSATDYSNGGLNGIQFANGMQNEGFTDGYRAWISMLLRGYRLTCLAGNDAHGNFNRFRQIGLPFISIRESSDQLYGKMRTAVFLAGALTPSAVLQSLSEGGFIITDGPILNILSSRDKNSRTSIGKQIPNAKEKLVLSARSTHEFGPIQQLRVFVGVIGEEHERLLVNQSPVDTYEYTMTLPPPGSAQCYVRAEVSTSGSKHTHGKSHFCFTNPVWMGRGFPS